jgi:hypothetical protein
MLRDDFHPTDQQPTCHPVCTSAATLRSQTSTIVHHQDLESRPEQHMTIDVSLVDTLPEKHPGRDLEQIEDTTPIIALSQPQ